MFIYVGIIVAGVTALYLSRPKYKWQEGPVWKRFLNAYGVLEAKQFAGCTSKCLESKFGSTQVFLCGDSSNQPVFLLHGMGESSLMFGDWIVPALLEKFYVVAIDVMGDAGKSLPKNGEIDSIPATKEDWSEWFLDIKQQLGIDKPVHLVGYSYGCFLVSQIALSVPDDCVSKVVFTAPAGVFSRIEPAWISRAILTFTLGRVMPTESMQLKVMCSFMAYMQNDFYDDVKTWSPDYLEYRAAVLGVAPVLKMKPEEIEMDALTKLTKKHPALLLIGDDETVTNPKLSVKRAQEAGVQVKTYDSAGHILFAGSPRELVPRDIFEFLV